MSASHNTKIVAYTKPNLKARVENYAKQNDTTASKVLVQAVEKLLAEKK